MYLLDTNICIFLIKNKFSALKQKIISYSPQELFISAITVAELEYGASKSLYREKNRAALLDFCTNFTLIDFSTEDSEAYGLIRAYLEKTGNPIGPYDMQIAAQGLSRGMTVVTNNCGEFSKVPDLNIEDWTK